MTGAENRWLRTSRLSGDEYDARYDRLADEGKDVHGEASFVMRFAPSSVLDAGCGTGRVTRELARRGVDAIGVDIDDGMLATARRRSPEITWHHADLASVDLGRTFDVVLLAGNVMIFLAPGTEHAVVANLARHLGVGGLLIAGFQMQPDRLTVEQYDAIATDIGLSLVQRWSTWDRDVWTPTSDYVLSVHLLSGPATARP